MAKLWDKGGALDARVEAFTVGDDPLLDQRLVPHDCRASIAHVRTLGKAGVLTDDEVEKLAAELEHIIELHATGDFPIPPELEDCHTAIEHHLTMALGDLGKKVHTGRSRNDQVLAALHLYYDEELGGVSELICELIAALTKFAEQHSDVPIPGHTHTRKAMPSSVGYWAKGFIGALTDDITFLSPVSALAQRSPLGTGAGYGVPLELDKEFTAKELGFKHVIENGVHAQLSRGKTAAAILHALSQVTATLNAMACDLILFSMPTFGYFELPKEMTTGSSIMPQKKNPDVLELVRASHHRVVAREHEVQGICSNLISGYHRDYQLTKGPVLTGLDTTKHCLVIMAAVIQEMVVNEENCRKAMTDELYATEEVYKLVREGVPFRDAYKQVSDQYR
ncbi:MAG: argininosuccinate lyase [Candidatus Undinarchaeales archaeon]|jgi:argininosuccinate lyase|nr:argininosuccinate lyase [Candidatus Undinarchaeales archaeon]MDP7494281.1 argininosuccinate lyase [Candidatus Undinarchaeales archaeon]